MNDYSLSLGLFGTPPTYGPEVAAAVKRTADFVSGLPRPTPTGVARNDTVRATSSLPEPRPLFGDAKTDPFEFDFQVHPSWEEPKGPSFLAPEPESLSKRFAREVRGIVEDTKNVFKDREFLMQLRDAEKTGDFPVTGYRNVYPRAIPVALGLATTQWNKDVLPVALRVAGAGAAVTLAVSPEMTPYAAVVPQALNRWQDAALDTALTRAAKGAATYSQMQLIEKYGAEMAASGGKPDYVGATLEAIYDAAMGSGDKSAGLVGTGLNAIEAVSIPYRSHVLGELANAELGRREYNGLVETAGKAVASGGLVAAGAFVDWWLPKLFPGIPVTKIADVATAAGSAAVGNYAEARLRAADYSRWAPALEEARDRNRSVYGHPVFR